MEHFQDQDSRVKEKSVYLLHLDTPRIILVSAVIIGVVAGAFLLGMNIINGDTQQHPVLFEDENSEMLSATFGEGDQPVDSLFDSIETESTTDSEGDILSADSIADLTGSEKNTGEKSETESSVADAASVSITTPDKKPSSSPEPARTTARTNTQERKTEPEKETRTAASKPQERKPVQRAEPRNSDVREVVYRSSQGNARSDVRPASRHGFSIQIASYDTMGKAEREVSRLKEMRYDAYVDSSTVNGRQFYRVRVGPFDGQPRAFSTLNAIQKIDRYSDSYIIHE